MFWYTASQWRLIYPHCVCVTYSYNVVVLMRQFQCHVLNQCNIHEVVYQSVLDVIGFLMISFFQSFSHGVGTFLGFDVQNVNVQLYSRSLTFCYYYTKPFHTNTSPIAIWWTDIELTSSDGHQLLQK